MIAASAQWLIILAGAWLVGAGVFMLLQPRKALVVLGKMGGSPPVHFGEMAVRFLAGLALAFGATASRFPLALTVIGSFLMITAIVLSILPRRWHAAYSTWWAERIPTAVVRLIAPLSWVMGAALIWTVI